MDYYIARQPIFDRERKVVGYELLYRENGENAYRGQDENISTMAVIRNAMLSNFHSLTEGKRGMINFPPDLIVEKYPLLFSPENLVVDLLNPEEGGGTGKRRFWKWAGRVLFSPWMQSKRNPPIRKNPRGKNR